MISLRSFLCCPLGSSRCSLTFLVLFSFFFDIVASNITVVKEVEAIMDPAAFTVVRFVDDVRTRSAVIELGFWVCLGYLSQHLGCTHQMLVIVVPLLDGMLGATVPAHTWFGALMSIGGLAILESSGSPPSIGDLLNFLTVVFFGVHMLRTEHVWRTTNRKNLLPLLGYKSGYLHAWFEEVIANLGRFGGVQTCDPPSWKWEMVWHWMTAFPWIPSLCTGIFSTGLCLWREHKATETAIIYGLESVWGSGFTWFLLGERMGAAPVLGKMFCPLALIRC
ncbi:hypothetical protein POPTR_008G130950v4 [Populus trichocarpa]|uniref:Uncharacterized protein n=1 Tax=Populus trichocarpa TaxID=3694 RepID=A0ACC0SLG4_POPTR|nr:hypothetical protein POPTR_008G130950v4 [Populus trichocarpa]